MIFFSHHSGNEIGNGGYDNIVIIVLFVICASINIWAHFTKPSCRIGRKIPKTKHSYIKSLSDFPR